MALLGLSLSLTLALAAKIFYVEEDPRLEAVKAALPGMNCGGCGYAGCEAAAKALFSGKAAITLCVAGGMEVVENLAGLLGIEGAAADFPSAYVKCLGGSRIEPRFYYQGAQNCRAAFLLHGGFNSCEMGCLGMGGCVTVCPFDAICMGPQRLPEINTSKCRGCGRCVDACPKGVIELVGTIDRLLHLNKTDECLAPCSQKCPAQIDVPRFIRNVCRNETTAALLRIKDRNPFPAAVGRTCPHVCENICRRNIADEGIAIGHLGRYLGDWERLSGKRIPIHCAADTSRKVAVVGGGPAGLSCAYFLRRLGHLPAIFESKPQLGGMLRYGIPGYRLPNCVVDWEVDGILSLGIDAVTSVALGRDFSLTKLSRKGFEAIFLGIGAWTTPHMCIPGEHLGGIFGSIDFLSRIGSEFKSLTGKAVTIIGESNTAMDCARSCIRLEASSVTVVCPCERKAMSARKRDVVRALEEGVRIEFLMTPIRVVSNHSGNVASLEYCRLTAIERGKDVHYVPVKESNAFVSTDLLILAYERKPDLTCLLENEDAGLGFRFTQKSTLDANFETMLAAAPNIFTAGDVHTGRATVIAAVAGGRLAARSIHHFLTSRKFSFPDRRQRRVNPKTILKDVQVSKTLPRVALHEVPVEVRCRSFGREVVATISAEQALLEAQRCLQCGSFCYER